MLRLKIRVNEDISFLEIFYGTRERNLERSAIMRGSKRMKRKQK
jgi:hypothetical protein